jgi:hypothetical protein
MLELCSNPNPQDELKAGPPEVGDGGDRSRELRHQFSILSPEDLADMIGIDTRTLAVWRAQKRGPDPPCQCEVRHLSRAI